MTTSRRYLITLIVTVLVGAACRPQVAQVAPDDVSVQLKWVHQAQFAGFYLAQERGYYADENIDVTFIPGGPNINATEEVASGRADFGVDAPENILRARDDELPVIAIATIFRHSPLVFVSHADSGIERPQDFAGKRVAIVGGGDVEIVFEAMMGQLGLDTEQVELLPYAYDHDQFRAREADVTFGYVTGGIIRLEQAGYEVNLIWPDDYGIHMYADTLLTSDQLVAENPDLATRFLRATLRGWREAIEEPEAAAAATMTYAVEADSDLQTQMMVASVPLIHTGEDQIGWMRAEVWQGMHDILLKQGILDEPLDLDSVYTTAFLAQIYGGARP